MNKVRYRIKNNSFCPLRNHQKLKSPKSGKTLKEIAFDRVYRMYVNPKFSNVKEECISSSKVINFKVVNVVSVSHGNSEIEIRNCFFLIASRTWLESSSMFTYTYSWATQHTWRNKRSSCSAFPYLIHNSSLFLICMFFFPAVPCVENEKNNENWCWKSVEPPLTWFLSFSCLRLADQYKLMKNKHLWMSKIAVDVPSQMHWVLMYPPIKYQIQTLVISDQSRKSIFTIRIFTILNFHGRKFTEKLIKWTMANRGDKANIVKAISSTHCRTGLSAELLFG